MNMDQLDFSSELFPDGEPRHMSHAEKCAVISNAFYSGMHPDELVELTRSTFGLTD